MTLELCLVSVEFGIGEEVGVYGFMVGVKALIHFWVLESEGVDSVVTKCLFTFSKGIMIMVVKNETLSSSYHCPRDEHLISAAFLSTECHRKLYKLEGYQS
jgi:hypothetical protein